MIFDHGQPIDKYYFLVSGKVFLEYRSTKPNEKVAIEILDGLNIIGEYFYDSSSKRIAKAETIPDENPTLLFSIDKAPFDFFYEPQILQYSQLKEKCS